MEESPYEEHPPEEEAIDEAERSPVKMQVEEELAKRWVRRVLHTHIDPEKPYPKECDDWFRQYNDRFSEILDQDAKNHISPHNGGTILVRYYRAKDDDARLAILEEIEHRLYNPITLHHTEK